MKKTKNLKPTGERINQNLAGNLPDTVSVISNTKGDIEHLSGKQRDNNKVDVDIIIYIRKRKRPGVNWTDRAKF